MWANNITAGLDLIRKKEGPEAKVFWLTIPLMLKADGTKFGENSGWRYLALGS